MKKNNNNIGELLKEFKELQNKTNEMFDKYESVIIKGHRNNCIIKNAYNSYKNRMWEILRIVDDIGDLESFMKEVKEVEEKVETIAATVEATEVTAVVEATEVAETGKEENKINDLLVEKANKLIESIEIEPNRSAAVYLDYAKENGIKTSDKNSIGRKILQYHLLKYGVSNVWYKAAEKHGVNTKEELCQVYFNQLLDMLRAEEETKTHLRMDLQTLATNKKELKPIFNSNIEGREEYQKEELKKYNSGALNFTHKRINNKMIEEYTKYFIYKDNTFMSVKPSEAGYTSGYYEHVRKYNYKVDHVNKVILFTDKEIEEVEPIKENLNNICKDGEVMKSKTVKQSKVNGALKRHNLAIKRNKKFYNSIDDKIEQYKNNNSYLYNYYIDLKENYKKDLDKSISEKENFINNILPKYTIIEDVEPIKEEFYSNNEVEPAEQTEKENNNYITLTKEQEKERMDLINLWSKKAPGDKEQGKERFLQLLFEYQEKKKTKEEFKKHINKLYAANKNIKAYYAGKKDFNNYLTDLLATENILQQNDIIKNEFFTNAYNYIKSVS